MHKIQMLKEMGIDVWIEKGDSLAVEAGGMQITDSLSSLTEKMHECKLCSFYQRRKQAIFGHGLEFEPQVLVVGERPSFEDNDRGELFTRSRGSLLNSMLNSIGINQQRCYFANLIKCYPGDDAKSIARGIHECIPYLYGQIELIQPQFILFLGHDAADPFLKSKDLERKLQSDVYYYRQKIPVIITESLDSLFASPQQKRDAWRDLQLLRGIMDDVSRH